MMQGMTSTAPDWHNPLAAQAADPGCPVVAEADDVRLLLHVRAMRGERSLVEAARLVGMNRDELSRLERGETSQVRFATLAKLIAAYDCDLADLVEVRRRNGAQPLYASALAALGGGTLPAAQPSRRAVRRAADADISTEFEADVWVGTEPAESQTPARRKRAAVGVVAR